MISKPEIFPPFYLKLHQSETQAPIRTTEIERLPHRK